MTGYSCAQYLLLKRQFFVNCWRRLVESGKAYTDVRLNSTLLSSNDAKIRHMECRKWSQFRIKDHHHFLRGMGVPVPYEVYLVAAWEELGFTYDAAIIGRGRLVDGWKFEAGQWVDSSGQVIGEPFTWVENQSGAA